MTRFTCFFFVFVLLGAIPLAAQNQEGSVAIASAIEPASQDVVGDFTGCVKELAPTVGAKEALKACKDALKLAVKAATRVANEAADATKASRPILVNPWGYRGGYTSYRYLGAGFSLRSRPPRPVRRPYRERVPRYSRPRN
jgi:hypothetical protein